MSDQIQTDPPQRQPAQHFGYANIRKPWWNAPANSIVAIGIAAGVVCTSLASLIFLVSLVQFATRSVGRGMLDYASLVLGGFCGGPLFLWGITFLRLSWLAYYDNKPVVAWPPWRTQPKESDDQEKVPVCNE
jgi:hypothetical protein